MENGRILSPGAMVAAVLLPPLGVYLARGLGGDFWITSALTCLGFVPGIIYALVTLLRPRLSRG